jgi:antirestriction protein ArdC
MIAQTEIYQQVTDRIISQLERGVGEWRKGWSSVCSGLPRNVAGRSYRGVNILLLWAAAHERGFDSSLWGTFNQWKNLGGHVNRGEKGTRIVFWRVVTETVRDTKTGEEKEERRFFCKQFVVFNLAQCAGDKLERFRTVRPVREFIDFAPAEEAILATGADIRHIGNRAFYTLDSDFVQLPPKVAFDSEAAYYSTALHELVHWSGHESRLDRLDKLARFGDSSYAAEELVAELGAAFLAASLGIPNVPLQDNAAYLRCWLKVLRADNRAIFTASTAASAAADYILQFSQRHETEDAVEEEPLLV